MPTRAAPSFSSAREAAGFSNPVFRWIWQFYTWRMTQAGRWFFWSSIGFLAYTTTSFEYQAYIGLSYAVVLWLVAFAAIFLFKPRMLLEARHADRVCAGELLPVELTVTPQNAAIHRDFHVSAHALPAGIDLDHDEGEPLPPLARGQKHRARMGLRCDRRGIYTLAAFRVETDFPFGLFRSYQVFPHRQNLLVYPSFNTLTRLEIPTGRRYQPGGVAMVTDVGESLEFIGNREFRDGDNIRDIDWRATARLSRPIVREYREEYFLRVALILDTHVPGGSNAEKNARRAALERAVSISASVGDYLARQEYVVDLFAAGPHLYHLMAGRGLAYLDQILDILACVDENPREPFDVIAPELMNNLARLSTVICVFLDWNDTRRQFVRMLREQGVGLKILVVNSGTLTLEPDEEGVRVLSEEELRKGVVEL